MSRRAGGRGLQAGLNIAGYGWAANAGQLAAAPVVAGGYTPAPTDSTLSVTQTPQTVAQHSPVPTTTTTTTLTAPGFLGPWEERNYVTRAQRPQVDQSLEQPNYGLRRHTSPMEQNLQGPLDGTPMQVVPPEVDDESELRLALGPPGWPLYVPPPELLHHLVETFFSCQPHAGRLLHRASFMASLLASPSSNEFPISALLHAICAMASFYTPVVDSPPPPNLADLPSEELWPRSRYKISSEQSFGDVHALWANMAGLKTREQGGSMLQVWITNGKAARAVLPMGLNVASNFSLLARHGSNRTPSVLPPAKSAMEEEERRNTLWVIYVAERLQSAETCWAMLLDDEDISQYLPLPDDLWNEGADYPLELRQRLASPNSLFTHPPALTSPFSLLVKSISILSKVKTFNIRFRNKYADTVYAADPRSAPEFEELDRLIVKFTEEWPEEYADAFSLGSNGPEGGSGRADPTLYLASLIPSVATIQLHDPHVDFSSAKCPSKKKMLAAVDVIMASIYQLSGTACDTALLDHYSSFCWLMAGMTLVRILKAKLDSHSHIEAIKMNAEIDIVK
ncbi:hypothetical protein FRB96_003671 [Tulasnella sp. 330]|nr:hypothetical protein FRB96_003671 [Tulasnella sp. 330]